MLFEFPSDAVVNCGEIGSNYDWPLHFSFFFSCGFWVFSDGFCL